MKAYWVIDILKDIRQFSEKNGMVELAEQLDDAIFVAATRDRRQALRRRNGRGWKQARLEALLERLQTTKSIDELQVWAHELRDHFGVTHVVYHTATLKSRAGRRLHLQPRLGAALHRDGLPQHRPGGARGAAAVPPDGLEDPRLVEPAGAADDARGDGGTGSATRAGRCRSGGRRASSRSSASTIAHRRCELGRLHRAERQGHPRRLAPDAPAGDADHQQGDRPRRRPSSRRANARR